MKIDFKKLFADKSKYSDDIKLTIGDAEVTLGDLRLYDTEMGGALQRELKTQQDALALERGKVQKASEDVAKLFVDLEKQKSALEATAGNRGHEATDPLARYESDEVFGPIVKTQRAAQAEAQKRLDDLTSKIDTLTKSIGQMGMTYMGDKAAQDFATIMATDDPVRPANLTLDALYKTAVEQRIYDRNNLPDLKETYKRMTADSRHQHEIAEAEKRGALAKQREIEENAMLPRPVSGMPPLPEGFRPPVNMNDAFGRAAGDKDLWKTIRESSAGVM